MFNWIDYAIIAIIALSVLVSIMRGFVREVVSLVVWIAAIIVSFLFYQYIADLLVDIIHSDSVRLIVSFLGLFFITLLLGIFINYLIGQLVSNTGLSGIDRILGIFFGVVRGLVVVVFLMMLADLTPFSKEESWQKSVLVAYFVPLENWTEGLLPDSINARLELRKERLQEVD